MPLGTWTDDESRKLDPLFFETGAPPPNSVVFLIGPNTPPEVQEQVLGGFNRLGKLAGVRPSPTGGVEIIVRFDSPTELLVFLVNIGIATLAEHTLTDLTHFESEIAWKPPEPGGAW